MSEASEIRRIAIAHHDAMSPQFERWYADYNADRFSSAFTYGRAKLDCMVGKLFSSLPEGAKVLDVGCGTGEHLKRAQRHRLVAVGVEPAPSMLKAAAANVPGAEVLSGVATELPFEDGEFDALLMIEVLRYLDEEDIDSALQEARRVLKPGGVLFVTLVNRWALDAFYLYQRIRQRRKGKECDEVNPYCAFFTPSEAEAKLRLAGFTNVRAEGRMLAPLRIIYRMSERLGRRIAVLVEKADDRIHRWRWTRLFAGHLIVLGERGSSGSDSTA